MAKKGIVISTERGVVTGGGKMDGIEKKESRVEC